MAIEWPPLVPFFNSLGEMSRSGPQGATIRTQMDAGPAKVRRRFTAAPMRFTGSTSFMTRAEVAAFEAFFAQDLAMGALPFEAVDPMTCTIRTYRFIDSYTVTPSGRSARISAELEILP